jgi:glycosyltransferase involved in cell wall biosynthesis
LTVPPVSVIIPRKDVYEPPNRTAWPSDWEVLYHYEPGVAHARNAGAKKARGPILVFVDSDVIVHGPLEQIESMPLMDVAWTAGQYIYRGDDLWTQFSAVALNAGVLLAETGLMPQPVHEAFMACRAEFFREFDDAPLEGISWGEKFTSTEALRYIAVEFTRPFTNSLEWRKRRAERLELDLSP